MSQSGAVRAPISRRIVNRHGGDISIDSAPGKTIFRMRLPDGPRRGGA
jgi:signal transduction histidine kinase